MAAVQDGRAFQVEGYAGTGRDTAVFEVTGDAVGRRRNELQVQMVRPWLLEKWQIAQRRDRAAQWRRDRAGAAESVLRGASRLFNDATAHLRPALRGRADRRQGTSAADVAQGQRRHPAGSVHSAAGSYRIDIQLESESPFENQQKLVAAAANGCFAEALLSVPVEHRLWDGALWVECQL